MAVDWLIGERGDWDNLPNPKATLGLIASSCDTFIGLHRSIEKMRESLFPPGAVVHFRPVGELADSLEAEKYLVQDLPEDDPRLAGGIAIVLWDWMLKEDQTRMTSNFPLMVWLGIDNPDRPGRAIVFPHPMNLLSPPLPRDDWPQWVIDRAEQQRKAAEDETD